jgi:uncharacterized membrane protein
MEPAETRSFPASLSRKLVILLPVGLILFGWLLGTPEGLLGKADAVGYAVCHRIEARSFFIGDRQVPLCARCSGMYLGAVLGLVYQAVLFPRRAGYPPRRLWPLLGLLVLAFGIDGGNSYLHFFPGAPDLYEPQNWSRLLTGTGMGLVMAVALFPAVNQSVWKDTDFRPALPGFKHFTVLAILGLVVAGLVWWENPLVLYPLALISAAGVLTLLTLVYTVLWILILKRDNQFEHPAQLWLWLAAGFGVGLVQIAVIDLLRFYFTGTWSGFNLG